MDKRVQLIYISRSTLVFDRQSLQELLRKSRMRNSEAGITGILLYKNGDFFQILEGPQSQVDSLYDVIRIDDRHKDIRLVSRKEDVEPIFGEWRMGFVDLGSSSLPGFSAALQNHKSLFELTSDMEVTRLLNDFKSGQFRKMVVDHCPPSEELHEAGSREGRNHALSARSNSPA